MRSIWLLSLLRKLPGSAKNFLSKIAGETGVRVSSFLFIFVLARRLGAAQFGIYSTMIAYATLFNIALESVSSTVTAREVARRPHDEVKIIGSAHFLKALLAVAALLGIHFVSYCTRFAEWPRRMIDGFGVVTLCYSLIDYAGFVLAGRSEMRQEAALRSICRGVIAVSGIICLAFTQSLVTIATVMSVSGIAAVVIAFQIVRRRFDVTLFTMDRTIIKELLFSSAPLLASYAFSLAYDNQDLLLLKHFGVADAAIGFYGSANKILDVLKVIPLLLVGAFFPTLAKAHADVRQFRRQVGWLTVYASLLIPLLVAGVYALAPFIEITLFGAAFAQAAPFLRLLMIAYVGIFVNYLNTYILIAGNYEKRMLPGAAAACVINFALCWRLIPTQGPLGVCLAMIGTEGLYLVYQTSLVAHRLFVPPPVK
jgi:O-antigen/teichoic acid export membrane protein